MLRGAARRGWARLAAAGGLGLAAVVAPVAATAAPVEKEQICHFDEDTGSYHLLALPARAAQQHLRLHADGVPGKAVPGTSTLFDSKCGVGRVETIDFDDVELSSPEVQLDRYAGFTWSKTWVFSPADFPQYGYGTASAPNVAFIGFPADGSPLVMTATGGDVDLARMFLTNPTDSFGDNGRAITVTVNAFDDGALVASRSVEVGQGASLTATLGFVSVDRIEMSADGQYFGIDDLVVHLPVG